MRLHFPNLVQALRVFIPAISFLIVLLIGGLVQADPLKMLLSAIFVYLFFVILGAVFAGILGRINEEISDERLGRPDDQLELGKIIDFSQKAELPFDDKARSLNPGEGTCMDTNVKVLMDATGCTETEAESVMTAAGNDVSKAMDLLQEQERDVLVFQVGFSSSTPSAGRGYLILVINIKSENIIHANLAYPLSAEQAKSLDINMPATVFGSTLKSIINDLAERHRAASRSNLSQLRSKMTSSFARALLADNRSSQIERIGERFSTLLNGIYNEEFTVKHTARAQSAQAIDSLLEGPERSLSPEQSAAKLFAEPGGSKTAPADPDEIPAASPQEELPKIVLICEPEISPFDGKAARTLAAGQEVIVKIKDGREAARYFAELLGGSVGDELVPLAVPIVKLDTMSETFVEAFVEFGPGIYGQFFVPPDVKIKVPDENVEIYNPFENEVSVFAEQRFGRHIMLGLTILIVSTIILIVTFLKIS